MNTPSRGDITRLLIAWSNGDRDAFDHLMPIVYDELRRIARGKLMPEARIRLLDQTRARWRDRSQLE